LAAHLLVALARRRGIAPAPRLSPEVLAVIERHSWAGNVRELCTMLDVTLILAGGSAVIELDHLPSEFQRAPDARTGEAAPRPGSGELATVEASAVRRALGEADGNVKHAAMRLGVARSTLYRMMRRHGIS
jgi:transcriptional regulator with PAS, ATPase and Fis domain